MSTFKIGDSVKKKSGSSWEGRIVGTYSTELTPEGYAVESFAHKGSVQIYPANALEAAHAALAEQPSGAQAQAFYKEPEAEPPYAQYARGMEDGFALGMRNAMQDAANAEQPSVREPLTRQQIERLVYEHTKLNPNMADDKELLGYIVNAVRAIEAMHGIGVKGEA